MAYRARFAQAGHVTDTPGPSGVPGSRLPVRPPGVRTGAFTRPAHAHMYMHMSSLYMYTRAPVCICMYMHRAQTYSTSAPARAAANARARLRARTSFPPLHPRFGLVPPAAAPAASAPSPASAAACADPDTATGWSHWRMGGGLGERDGAVRRRASRGGVRASGATAAPATGAACGRDAPEQPPQHLLPTPTLLQPSAMSRAAGALVGAGNGVDSCTCRSCGGGW